MDARRLGLVLAFALAGLVGAGPNVVVVLTDDQGYGDLSCHGNPHLATPNLDALRGQSTAFDRFFVSPTCAPTRAALLTGRHEFRCGVSHTIMGRSLLRPGIPTLAEKFRAAGYRTAIAGKWHLGDAAPCRPEDRGFEHVFVHGGGGIGQTPDCWGNRYHDPSVRSGGGWKKTEGYCSDVFFDEALRWIGERAEKKEPFLMWLATNAPHWPYDAPAGSEKKFRDAGIEGSAAPFYAMIENIDDNVGRLVKRLDELDLANDTVLVFLTDNGSAVGHWNAGMKGTKGSPDEGGVRVPCFVRWPGKIAAGRVVGELAGHIDLMPTLAGLCGVDLGEDADVDGDDLSAALLGKQEFPVGRVFITQVGRWSGADSAVRHRASQFAVRDDRWRLVGTSLYDMRADPGQTKNVFEEQQDVAARLLGRYGIWWDRILPELRQPVRYRIGSGAAAVSRLTAHDWWPSKDLDGPPAANLLWDQGGLRQMLKQIKAGERKEGISGHWKLEAMRGGHYRVRMAMIPSDAGDAESGELGKLKAGTANLWANRSELRMEILRDAQAVSFGIDLEKGAVDVEAWFGGQLEGEAKLGAFFVEIEWVGERKLPELKFELR